MAQSARRAASGRRLLDHLPRETIFLLCEPESLAAQADELRATNSGGVIRFLFRWPDFLARTEPPRIGDAGTVVEDMRGREVPPARRRTAVRCRPLFGSLDAFRPLAERAPEPQIAEAQRREFFQQLHRWLRQDYAVHVFCNNDGERQRFERNLERNYGFGHRAGASAGLARGLHTRLAGAGISSATRPGWWWSRTRKFSGATRSSGRAA